MGRLSRVLAVLALVLTGVVVGTAFVAEADGLSPPPPIGLRSSPVTLTAQAYGTRAADLGKILEVTSGSADSAVTLMSASLAGNGAIEAVRKATADTVAVTGTSSDGGLIKLAVASTTGRTSGDTVCASTIGGTVEANGCWQITVIDGTHLDLNNSAFVNAWTSGGALNGGRVVVNDGSVDQAWLSAPGDVAFFQSNGTSWQAYKWNIKPLWFVREDAGGPYTVTMPPLYSGAYAEVISAGGGGGSGRQGATSTARSGGTGANAGVYNDGYFSAGAIGATASITVGTRGTGGPVQSTADLDGSAGNSGGASNFALLLTASGGSAGKAGTSAAVTSPSAQSGQGKYSPVGVGGPTSVTGAGTAGTSSGIGGGAGGPGASLQSNNTELAAAAGAIGGRMFATALQGTAGAAATTATGNTGAAGGNKGFARGIGGGGGGGATHGSSAGGKGGAGGAPGGAGGGGSASLDGASSGAGGDGADGAIRWVAYF